MAEGIQRPEPKIGQGPPLDRQGAQDLAPDEEEMREDLNNLGNPGGRPS